MKMALAFVLALFAVSAGAMTEFELTCEACHYHAILPDGPTKIQAKKKMRYPKIFFCPAKKTFISVLDAKKTKHPVEGNAQFTESRSRSCKGPVIPLDFYESTKAPCPVCNSGALKITALKIID